MQAARMESLPMGDILDFLKAGQDDVLDLDTLGFIFDEAVENMEDEQLAGAGGSGTAPATTVNNLPAQQQQARLSHASGTDILRGPAYAGAAAPAAPTLVGGVLLPGLKVEEHHATSSMEETTPMAAAAAPLQGLGLPGMGMGSGFAPALQGPGASSFGNTSLGSAHSGSAVAAAAAAAVAALQQQQQQAAQPTFSAYEDGAQSRRNRSNTSLNKVAAAVTTLQETAIEVTGDVSGAPPKKKRTRNAEQMEQNRQAQQKYRERKKAEHEQLNKALEQLTAQLAAMKAMEAQAMLLRNQNQALANTVDEQAARLNQLTVQVEAQAAELVEARRQAAEASALAATQQRMILDQHQKLQLQEEVISALKGRLQDKMDEAFRGHDQKTVCQRMVAAVRQAIEGASNVEGLQESLAQLPDSVVTDICRSILHEVKNMWPELAVRFQQAGLTGPPPSACHAEACAC